MKGRILIVDDEEGLRYTFETLLSQDGHQVMGVSDYQSALATIGHHPFDLIFADILLAGHSGIDILKAVKKKGLNIPVIMITGQPTLETAADSVRLGAFDYLPKPVLKETLLRTAHVALHHKALADEKDRIAGEKERYRTHLEAIFQSVREGIVTVDRSMRVISANRAMETICGVSAQEMLGNEFPGPPYKCGDHCRKVLLETLNGRKPIQEREGECYHALKGQRRVVLNSSPLLTRQGDFNGAVLVIRDVTRINDLERELAERHHLHNLVGKSDRMQEIYRLIENLSETETTVLITGESGTGKELVARALHHTGTRASKPFIKVNCSALPESLLESELFGHAKGAFTGAIKDRKGRFLHANHGTLLLDEIGDISRSTQAKLLRVLEEREFERVGETKPIKVNVRIISATNRDLSELVRSGRFRQDLFYRLKVVEIQIPPLRNRLDDVPLLVDHFCERFNRRFKKTLHCVSDEVLNRFMGYAWPGNVRELRHALEHAFVLCPSGRIEAHHLPKEIRKEDERGSHLLVRKSRQSPALILQTLKRTGWNKAKAARLLNISRPTLYKKMREYDLAPPREMV